MGLITPASWRERHRAEPERLGTDGLRAYSRDVVWPLLTLIALPRSHHSPKILEPCRFSHSYSSNSWPSVPSLVTEAYIHLRDHGTVVAELLLRTRSITLPLFTGVRGIGILGSSHTRSSQKFALR